MQRQSKKRLKKMKRKTEKPRVYFLPFSFSVFIILIESILLLFILLLFVLLPRLLFPTSVILPPKGCDSRENPHTHCYPFILIMPSAISGRAAPTRPANLPSIVRNHGGQTPLLLMLSPRAVSECAIPLSQFEGLLYLFTPEYLY